MAGTNVILISVYAHPASTFGDSLYNGLLERLYNSESIDLEMDFKVPIIRVPYEANERQHPQFNTSTWEDYDHHFVLVVLDEPFLRDNRNVQFVGTLLQYEGLHPNTKVIGVSPNVDLGEYEQITLFGGRNILRPLAFLRNGRAGLPETEEFIFSIFYIEFYHLMVRSFVRQRVQPIRKVTLFLSHTKKGGEDIAVRIKNFIESGTQLDNFFDVQDIPIGEFFEDWIRQEIDRPETIFLAIITDNYSSRPVCKMEMLYAKKKRRPIIAVSALEYLERRSFPYINNTPVVKWDYSETKLLKIVELALREFLRTEVILKEINNFVAESGTHVNDYLSYPPELLTIAHFGEVLPNMNTILYPNPLLDEQEKLLLRSLCPTINFITPWI